MANVIGRASVRIWPDTRKFRRSAFEKLRADIEAVEKKLPPVEIDAAVNFRTAEQQLRRFIEYWSHKKIQLNVDLRGVRQADAALNEAARDRTAKITAKVDTRGLGRDLDDAARGHKVPIDVDTGPATEAFDVIFDDFDQHVDRMREDMDRAIKPQVDLRDFDRQLGRMRHSYEANMRKLESDTRDIMKDSDALKWRVKIDDDARRQLLDEMKDLGREAREHFNIKDKIVELSVQMNQGGYRKAQAQLMLLARTRIASIVPVVSKPAARAAKGYLNFLYGGSGLKSKIDLGKNFLKFFENIDKNAPKVALLASAFTSLTAAVVGSAGQIGLMGTQIVQLSAAGLALPGILGGMAIGAAAFMRSLKDLPKQLPKVVSDFHRLNEEGSKRFWQQAKVPMLEAWNKALPSLSTGLQKTYTALGKWTGAFATALSKEMSGAPLTYMFDNLAKSIDVARGGLPAFARSMSILGVTGSHYLPKLAGWFKDVNEQFASWLTKKYQTGELFAIIDRGIRMLKNLAATAYNVGRIFYDLGRAAEDAGFNGVGNLRQQTERLWKAMESPKGAKALREWMGSAKNVFDGVFDAIGLVIQGLGNLGPAMQQATGDLGDALRSFGGMIKGILSAPEFQKGFTDLFAGLKKGMGYLKSAGPEIGAVLGSVGSVAGAVAENIGRLAGHLLKAFGPKVSQAVAFLAPKIQDLGGSLDDLIEVLDKTGIGDWIIDLASGLANLTADGVTQQIDNLTQTLDGLYAITHKGKSSEGGTWLDQYQKKNGDKKALAKAFGPLFNFGPTVNEAAQALGNFAITMKHAAQGFWNVVGSLFTVPANFAWTQLKLIGAFFAQLGQGIANAWNGFWNFVTGLFKGGDSKGGKSALGNADLFSGLTDMFEPGPIVSKIAGKISGIVSGIGNLVGTMFSTIRGLFGGGKGDAGGGGMDLSFAIKAKDFASKTISDVIAKGKGVAGKVWSAVLKAKDAASKTVATVKGKIVKWAKGAYHATLKALDKVAPAVRTAKAKITKWAKGKYRAALHAISKVGAGVSSARKTITAWAHRKYRAALTALNRTQTGLAHARASIRSVTSRAWRATVSVVHKGVGAVQRAINGIRGKTVQIFANVVGKGKKFLGFANGGIVNFYKDGGVTGRQRDPRMRFFNESHLAQIAPPGAMRVWAEPETGGEAYIPLAKAKRARSESILSDVAERFGGTFTKHAAGSVSSGAPQSSGSYRESGDVTVNVSGIKYDSVDEFNKAVTFSLNHLRRGGRVG